MANLIICEFLEPVELGKIDDKEWVFSKMVCEPATQERYELIQNLEYPEREFYLEKTFTYGELFLIFAITLVLIFGVAGKITDYFWKK